MLAQVRGAESDSLAWISFPAESRAPTSLRPEPAEWFFIPQRGWPVPARATHERRSNLPKIPDRSHQKTRCPVIPIFCIGLCHSADVTANYLWVTEGVFTWQLFDFTIAGEVGSSGGGLPLSALRFTQGAFNVARGTHSCLGLNPGPPTAGIQAVTGSLLPTSGLATAPLPQHLMWWL